MHARNRLVRIAFGKDNQGVTRSPLAHQDRIPDFLDCASAFTYRPYRVPGPWFFHLRCEAYLMKRCATWYDIRWLLFLINDEKEEYQELKPPERSNRETPYLNQGKSRTGKAPGRPNRRPTACLQRKACAWESNFSPPSKSKKKRV